MRHRAAFLGVLLLLGLVTTSYAQTLTILEQVEVDLWPEYDRRAVLVIYRVQLAESAPLPQRVGLPIPASVGEPHAVAAVDPVGGLINAAYERTVDGDQATIWVEADNRALWLEYYDDLEIADRTRSFTFEWPAEFDVNLLLYQVQQPLDASQFQVEPTPLNASSGEDGLTYHTGTFGNDASSGRSLRLSYVRSSDAFTVESLAPEPVATPAAAASQTLAPILGVLAGVALIGGTVFLVVRRRQRQTRKRPARRRQKAEPKAIFCHQCGTRAAGDDRFCRQCGTELRRQ